MVSIGTMAGKKTTAVITDMDQPLGYAVGNSVEVMEAIDALQGRGPEDFKQVVFALGGQMLQAAGRADSQEEAEKTDAVCDRGWNRFKEVCSICNGTGEISFLCI